MGMVHTAHDPDSWEGWHGGAMPMWGNSHRLGIAHTWPAEDLYDKEYVAERTTGFDEWKDYVLGVTDNVPKTPAGYRMLYRMFAHSTGLKPTVNAHDSTEGIAIPRLRIPESMMHEKFEWRGKGFCGRPSRARCRSTSTPLRATRSSPCTGATAARSSAPCSRPSVT